MLGNPPAWGSLRSSQSRGRGVKNGALVDVDVTGNQQASLFLEHFPVLRMWNPHDSCFIPWFLRWFSTGTLGPKLWEYINQLSLFGFTMFYPIWCLCFSSQQLLSQEPKESARIEAAKEAEKGTDRRAGEFVAKSLVFFFFFFSHLWHLCNQNHFWSEIIFFQRGASRCVWTLDL